MRFKDLLQRFSQVYKCVTIYMTQFVWQTTKVKPRVRGGFSIVLFLFLYEIDSIPTFFSSYLYRFFMRFETLSQNGLQIHNSSHNFENLYENILRLRLGVELQLVLFSDYICMKLTQIQPYYTYL